MTSDVIGVRETTAVTCSKSRAVCIHDSLHEMEHLIVADVKIVRFLVTGVVWRVYDVMVLMSSACALE